MYHGHREKDYTEFLDKTPLTLCSGLVYRRNKNRLEHAQRMNALIFDWAGVGMGSCVISLSPKFDGDPKRVRRLPMLTFLVLSGNGLGLYYVFKGADRFIPQYPSPA